MKSANKSIATYLPDLQEILFHITFGDRTKPHIAYLSINNKKERTDTTTGE